MMNTMNEAQIEQYMERFQEKLRQAELDAAAACAAGAVSVTEYLVFAVGGQEYGVPLALVKATLGLPPCVPVPFVPAHYRGVANVRGQIVSVIDLRLRLGHEAVDSADCALVVLEQGEDCVGFVVDSINRALSVKDESELKPVLPLDAAKLLQGEIL